ncbi:poly(3-hydroxyalkanoate) depolymerase [Salinisphaera sp. PC39]|uniref:alpha/beta fold hydrolase n=1 Tax=Salinisphaera sp. PC39 TaxID=1304156 RepID=UPI00334256A8
MDWRIRRVTVDGEHLRAAIRPGEGVPLVLCSELGANFELLAPFVDALERSEIVLFDVPGVGGSGLRQPLRRMSGYADLTAGLLDALGYEGPVDMLGAAWGGFLAQAFAHRPPARLRRLVLAATSPGQVMFPGRLASLWRLATPTRFRSARRYAAVAESVYGGRAATEPALIRDNAAAAKIPSHLGYASQLLSMVGFSSLPWLHRLYTPTLILAGDDDPVIPLVNARLLNLLLPRSRLHVVRGAGHLLLVTRPAEVASVVARFLAARDLRDELPAKDIL